MSFQPAGRRERAEGRNRPEARPAGCQREAWLCAGSACSGLAISRRVGLGAAKAAEASETNEVAKVRRQEGAERGSERKDCISCQLQQAVGRLAIGQLSLADEAVKRPPKQTEKREKVKKNKKEREGGKKKAPTAPRSLTAVSWRLNDEDRSMRSSRS